MMIQKTFNHANGLVEGVYTNAGEGTPLVIVANGHNGFYRYGMFPHICQKLAEKHISTYNFNYSHGGTEGNNDVFTRLDLYEKNCMRLEKEDILSILESDAFGRHSKIFILTHSLGGVPTVFAAKDAAAQNLRLHGIILVSAVSRLDFWSPEVIEKWKQAGVYHIRNNRTQQDLPQGPEFLSEILKANDEWNMEIAVKSLQLPVCVIHGEADEAVPLNHGTALFAWCSKNNPLNEFTSIPGAGHTFNTKHPFAGTTPELEKMINAAVCWIEKTS